MPIMRDASLIPSPKHVFIPSWLLKLIVYSRDAFSIPSKHNIATVKPIQAEKYI
jgi:hypothetical protein